MCIDVSISLQALLTFGKIEGAGGCETRARLLYPDIMEQRLRISIRDILKFY